MGDTPHVHRTLWTSGVFEEGGNRGVWPPPPKIFFQYNFTLITVVIEFCLSVVVRDYCILPLLKNYPRYATAIWDVHNMPTVYRRNVIQNNRRHNAKYLNKSILFFFFVFGCYSEYSKKCSNTRILNMFFNFFFLYLKTFFEKKQMYLFINCNS